MNQSLKRKLGPLALGAGLLILDQASKAIIVKVSGNARGIIWQGLNDLLWIVHERNLGAAFSLLDGLPTPLRLVLLGLVPLLVLALMVYVFLKLTDLGKIQEFALLAIVAGGMGNIIDRLFRTAGVVDFVSVKFFGLFGFDRWPTFNVADSCIVVGCVVMILSFIIDLFKPGKAAVK